MLWLFLSVIQKRKTGASDQNGKAEGKKTHKHFYSKGNPVISHFKRSSILGYIYTAFILVWEE